MSRLKELFAGTRRNSSRAPRSDLTLKIHGNPRWTGRMIPTPENTLLASTVLTTGENGCDIKMSSSEIWSLVQSLQIFRGLKYMSCIQYWYVYIYRFSYVSTLYWNNSAAFEEKFLNVTAQFAIPSIFKDWDTVKVSCENVKNYEENWRKVSREMKALVLLFTVENILLLTPLFILNHTITIRNTYLNDKFPQIGEELFSTNLVFSLTIIMPVVYIVFAFIQYVLFIVYNKHGHPWAKIFKYENLIKIL